MYVHTHAHTDMYKHMYTHTNAHWTFASVGVLLILLRISARYRGKTKSECSFIELRILFEAEMHLYNPLLKGATFVPSCLILCRVLLQGNQLLLYFSSHITKLCYLTAENIQTLWILIYFVQLYALLVSLCETGSIICNLLCTYAILFPCSRKLFLPLFFCVLLIPISLYNLLPQPEERKFISLLFFSLNCFHV